MLVKSINLIHSYWSKPSITKFGNHSSVWFSERHHALSWAFSLLRLKTLGYKVTLYTDSSGYEWLIENLNLPYDNVDISLDQLSIPNNLWSLAKMWVYSEQKEPFIHFDGDVYIWNDDFIKELNQNDIICQHIERDFPYYKDYFEILIKERYTLNENIFPRTIDSFDNIALNCGVIGGYNIGFFRTLWNEAYSLYKTNEAKSISLNMGVNTLFEQHLAYKALKNSNLQFKTALKQEVKYNDDFLPSFEMTPFEKKYVHLSTSAKKSPRLLKELENRMMYEFPTYYDSINKYYQAKKQISFFIQPINQEDAQTVQNSLENKSNYLSDFDHGTYDGIYSSNFNIDTFLSNKFILSPKYTQVSLSKIYNNITEPQQKTVDLEITNPLTNTSTEHIVTLWNNQIFIEQIKDWDNLLTLFEEPLSGIELLNILNELELISDRDVDKSKSLVSFFLLSKVTGFQYLKIHNEK